LNGGNQAAASENETMTTNQRSATAMELLAILQSLVNAVPVGGGMIRFDGDELAAARAAISRASGK
jgi:hypothetical protein